MRPRYLEIEGLQSFKDVQKIDFDQLSETGLFGIFGPTGSGKSTVLDAITFALYGKVTRASMGTQGIINTNSSKLRVCFTFDLLKNDIRKTYKVERVYARKKGTENSSEPKLVRLLEIEEDIVTPLADKVTDVNVRIEELLGLKHDDFTRAVVLPQNKFQEFLFMDKSKKREMLERIFYLEEYGRDLNIKLSDKISNVKLRLSNVEGALSALGDASDDAVELAEKELKEANEEKEKAVSALKDAENKYNEAKELWTLVEDLQFIEQKQKDHFLESNANTEKKDLLEKAQKAEILVDLIEKYKITFDKLKDVEDKLVKINLTMPEVSKRLENTKKKYQDKVKESEELKPKLLEQKAKLNNALEIITEIIYIDKKLPEIEQKINNLNKESEDKTNELVKGRTVIEQKEKVIEDQRKKIELLTVDIEYKKQIQKGVKLEEELFAVKDNFEKLKVRRDSAEAKVKELEEGFLKANEQLKNTSEKLALLEGKKQEHENLKPGNRNEVTELIEKYHKLKSALTAIKSKKVEIDSISQKYNDINQSIEKQKIKLIETIEEKENIQSERDNKKTKIESIRKYIETNAAYMLARNLKEGEPCPVCGSNDHPKLDKHHIDYKVHISNEFGGTSMKDLEEKLNVSQEELQKLESMLREVENKCIGIEEKIKNLAEQNKQLKTDLDSNSVECLKLTEMLPDNMKFLKDDLLEMEIENINRNAQEKLKQINAWEQKLDAINENFKKGTDLLNEQKILHSKIQSELNVNKDNLKLAEDSVKDASSVFVEKENTYKSFVEQFSFESASKELDRINKNEEEIDKLQKDMRKQENNIKSIRVQLETIQEEKQSLLSKLSSLESDSRNIKQQKEEKVSKVKDLVDCILIKDVERKLDEIEEKITNLSNEEKLLLETLNKYQEEFTSLSIEKSTLDSQKIIYTENYENESKTLIDSLKKHGFKNIEEAEKAVLDKERQSNIKKEIDEFEKIERNLVASRNIIEKKLNNKTITKEQWDSISQFYQEKVLLREEKVSNFQVAKSNFERVKGKNSQWTVLNDEYKELNKKADMLEQIKSLLRGNSFIEYVAEERLRYVAREASEILDKMTSHRYALELDTDVGFVIRDNANGGVNRMVTSLSGGETFITSLSLALALSKQIQLKGQSPLEFFFLDEGFGTLDSRLLDMVLDSLERLSTKERTIGVISHVPEMRVRIPRRLVITPPSESGTGSQVSIEKG